MAGERPAMQFDHNLYCCYFRVTDPVPPLGDQVEQGGDFWAPLAIHRKRRSNPLFAQPVIVTQNRIRLYPLNSVLVTVTALDNLANDIGALIHCRQSGQHILNGFFRDHSH